MSGPLASSAGSTTDWWRTAVVYQVYLRSYSDGDGDGIGDIAGLRARLDHIASLGADAIWISPWYPSPMFDAGYDVADPRGVEPLFGTLEDAKELLADAHRVGLRVLLDIVPNHTSAAAPKFQAALAGDVEGRSWYHFVPGKGPEGNEPPNNWTSGFGGPAWTRTTNPDGTPGYWYLHMFSAAQPDLNWSHPAVGEDYEKTLRFWFDLGIDGFRIDSANGLVKAEGLPDLGSPEAGDFHPAWDQPGIHDIYRGWRRIADSYDPPKIFVAEAWFKDPHRLARYLRTDELHTGFDASLIEAPFRAGLLHQALRHPPAAANLAGAPPIWVLSNHDTVRHRTRYARSQPEQPRYSDWDRKRWPDEVPDLALGLARARAAALLILALPGSIYLFQGDELGLDEVEDIPDDVRQDPTWEQSGHTDPGRDGCRVPLPWAGDRAPYAFVPAASGGAGDATPWLPQPDRWVASTVETENGRPASTLSLYRAAHEIRHRLIGGQDKLHWLGAAVDQPDQPAADESETGRFGPELIGWRTGGLTCVLNAGLEPAVLPADLRAELSGLVVVLASAGRSVQAEQACPDQIAGSSALWLAPPGEG